MPSSATPPAAAPRGRCRQRPEGSDRTRRAKWRVFGLYARPKILIENAVPSFEDLDERRSDRPRRRFEPEIGGDR